MIESKEVGLVSQEQLQQFFVEFGNYLVSGDAHEVLALLGEVSKASRAVKLAIDVRNWHMLHKIRAFIETLDAGKIDGTKYQKLCKKYGQNKVLSEVLISLDRFRNEAHSRVLAHLMAALINEKLDWERFCALSFALELLNPQDIESYMDDQHLGASFITAGLAYMTYSFNGEPLSITQNGKLFNDFYEFGLEPYLSGKSGAL